MKIQDFMGVEVSHHSQLLRHIINVQGWKYGAELGVLAGKTFGLLLRDCKTLRQLIGVDIFKHIPDAPGEKPYRDVDHERNLQMARAIAKIHPNRAALLEMTTHEAAQLVRDESLDFVFIDADHSYEGVKLDIADWAPKVKPEGWLLGHDLAPGFPGVRKAVTEAFGEPLAMDIRNRGVDGVAFVLPSRMWAAEKKDWKG